MQNPRDDDFNDFPFNASPFGGMPGFNMGMPNLGMGMFGQSNPMNMAMQMFNGGFQSPMSMFGFPNMANMANMTNMPNNGGFSYCSSSVTSYTTDEHGRPQVYQQSQEINQGPDGLRETKSSLRDSRSGRQEMSIGHHLYDQAHIKKKTRNAYTGDEEEEEELVNLEEDEADRFEQNWNSKAKKIVSSGSNYVEGNNRLALEDAQPIPKKKSSRKSKQT